MDFLSSLLLSLESELESESLSLVPEDELLLELVLSLLLALLFAVEILLIKGQYTVECKVNVED